MAFWMILNEMQANPNLWSWKMLVRGIAYILCFFLFAVLAVNTVQAFA